MSSERAPLVSDQVTRDYCYYRSGGSTVAFFTNASQTKVNGLSSNGSIIKQERKTLQHDNHSRNGDTPDSFETYGWKVFLSVNMADFCRKVVMTSFLANFVLYASTHLNCTGLPALLMFLVVSFLFWTTCGLAYLVPSSVISTSSLVKIGLGVLVVGNGLLTVLTAFMHRGSTAIQFSVIVAFVAICIGAGLLTVSLTEFGKQQSHFRKLSEISGKKTDRLYWMSHVIAIFIIILVTLIEQTVSFEVGYGICTTLLLICLMIFLPCAKKHELTPITSERPFRFLIAVCREAKVVRKTYAFDRDLFDDSNGVWKSPPSDWLDYATIEFGGTFDKEDVNDVRSFLKIAWLLPTFIPYWIIHAQGFSTFIYQGLHLNLSINGVQIPVASISMIGMILSFSLFAFSDKFIAGCFQREESRCPAVFKIMFGMVLASFAGIAAALIEMKSVQELGDTGTFLQEVGLKNFTAVQVSVVNQLPQFILWSSSEILVGMTALGLINKSCPVRFQRLTLSWYYFTIAVGTLIAMIILSCGWFPGSYFIDDSLQKYFFLLGGGMGVFALLFIAVLPDNRKTEKNIEEKDSSENSQVEVA